VKGRGGVEVPAPEDVPDFLAQDTVALFTPVANGKVLAAICALNGCRCDVIEVAKGTLAIMEDTSEGVVDRAASGLAAFAKDATVLAMERREGQLSVVSWTAGVRGDDLPPGLALDRAPDIVVDLMTGAVTIDDVLARDRSKVHSGRMGRFHAFWRLRKLARQSRREHAAAAS
jgi:hypothetical protein